MDKNTITGLILIAAVLIGFSWYNTNQERNLQQIPQTEQTNTPDAQNKKALPRSRRSTKRRLPTAPTSSLLLLRVTQTMWCLATIR